MVNLVVQNFLENKNLYNKIYEDLRKDLDESIPINHVGAKSKKWICYKINRKSKYNLLKR